MLDWMLAVLILLPIAAGLAVFTVRNTAFRNGVVLVTAGLLTVAAIKLLLMGPIADYTPTGPWASVITVLDFIILFILLYIAIRLKSLIIGALTVAQIALISYFDFGLLHQSTAAGNTPLIFVDQLAIIMVLIISVIGSLITLFAIPYMAEHEKHQDLKESKQPRFFAILLLFLGAMNALVLANDLILLILAWELTTLCSFLLISHDGTQLAIKNATRALLLNSLGGVALGLGLVTLFINTETTSIQAILSGDLLLAGLMLPLALFCFAGFTKSAQMPFQSWLLGAMVAPTPVSAMLHSSTMVKAGVYIIVRLAPAFAGTLLSDMVALVGAFTFVMASALCISQSNGKKILAYSTIANLGLIIVAAGINTPVAYAAAIILIVFHAISKALLFLCVGTVEHGIGSKDIDNMHGLYQKMPFTATIALIGMLTMFLPPFGMLLGKWATLEAAPNLPLVMILLVFGSALTMVFWLRWAGSIMSTSSAAAKVKEDQHPLIKYPLVFLAGSAVVLSVVVAKFYEVMVAPVVVAFYGTNHSVIATTAGNIQFIGAETATVFGSYAVWPLFGVVLAVFIFGGYALTKTNTATVSSVYMCGEIGEVDDKSASKFRVAGDEWCEYETSHYYLDPIFGENKLTTGSNALSLVILIVLFGVVLI
ncbi:ech hydrogenase subunit A [Desulfitispora alkaliphila]|uniref:NADH-quinone oxidoreductase subunit 5 family protein n=1 Tax=Desulfitispora alkaliphila TaxID=622674 RepID=UPI003D194FE4